MYLAPKINRRLDKMRAVLTGSVPLEVVHEEVEKALKPWGCNVYLHADAELRRPDFCCGGLYDWSKTRRPIDINLHFNQRNRCYNFTEKNWRNFRFLISQVLQHELIHKSQYSHRMEFENGGACLYYDIKAGEKSDKDHMDYLAELDEIDAYAHDIAMEIAEYYPRQDPYAVLRNIDTKRKLWSWRYYKNAFKDSPDWSDVHNRLLKKTFKWIPHVK